MAEKQIMVKIDHVSKEYRLGAIGGTTLREDLERFHAKIRKKEEMILRNRLSFLLFIMLRTLPFYLFLFARNSLIF